MSVVNGAINMNLADYKNYSFGSMLYTVYKGKGFAQNIFLSF